MTLLELQGTLYRQGEIDNRRRLIFGLMNCYQGEFPCIAAIKDNRLRIYNSDKSMKLGELRMEFVIPNLNITKASSFFIAPRIEFEYAGRKYKISNFDKAREFIAVLTAENQR